MGSCKHVSGPTGPKRFPPTSTSPKDAEQVEQNLRKRRAALLVKAVASGKADQKFFERALKAHEIDTLNLIMKEQING